MLIAWDDTKSTGSTLTASEWNNHVTDQQSRAAVSSGSGAPGTTPSMVGALYVDTTNNRTYIAIGTSSSSDWKEMMISG